MLDRLRHDVDEEPAEEEVEGVLEDDAEEGAQRLCWAPPPPLFEVPLF